MNLGRGCLLALIAAAAGATALDAAGAEAGGDCGGGREIYAAKCSQCHGESGDGSGIAADFFRPRPRDFTSGAFKIRTTESGELPTDRNLASIIRNGMPYTGMPAWPRFTDEELAGLVCYLKSFNADFSDSSLHPKAIEIPKPPPFSRESAERGKALYRENKCMDCHGRLGRGDGESGPTLKDDWGHPIRPADLTRRWTFRGGPHREDIYRTFMTGLNGTPMPSFASSIEDSDRWRLVDYVYSLSKADEPGYASLVTADSLPAKLDPDRGAELFKNAEPALFPVVGQVIEGNRDFFPAANAVEVRAVYDADNLAVMVSWHDMSAEKTGANAPTGNAPLPASGDSGANAAAELSDAIALQLPYKQGEGNAKPYFLFGDKRNPAEILFSDLAAGDAKGFLGKGREALSPLESGVETKSSYANGEWSVIFIRPRRPARGMALETGAFVPIAFSVWDGLSGETGDRRGVTSWYTLYLTPSSEGNPFLPAAGKALAVAALELAIVLWARRGKRRPDPA